MCKKWKKDGRVGTHSTRRKLYSNKEGITLLHLNDALFIGNRRSERLLYHPFGVVRSIFIQWLASFGIWNDTKSQPLDIYDWTVKYIDIQRRLYFKKKTSHLLSVSCSQWSHLTSRTLTIIFDSSKISFFEPGEQVYRSIPDEPVSIAVIDRPSPRTS